LLPEDNEVESLNQCLRSHHDLSLVKITPAHLEILNQSIPHQEMSNQTNAFILGGEALLGNQVEPWTKNAPETRIINEYGPTETVVGCCIYEVDSSTDLSQAILIGRPIDNTTLYILDSHLNPVPVGVYGELHIGGDGLARGYLKRPELTAEKFIINPFDPNKQTKLYKTGDLCRYLPDGNIEYIGRIDHQVKIRGFRIELGEIESLLSSHPDIRENVVIAKEDQGNQRLVAYIVSDTPEITKKLREYLKTQLPEYMIPSAFVLLENLPLTPNGKIDRKALPTPDFSNTNRDNFIPPSTPTQQILASIWQTTLKIEQISLNDNFFELGGHSLLATQIISRIRETFSLDLPIRSLFEHPTLEQLSQQIETSQQTEITPILPVSREGNLPLSYAQQRLWFLDQLEGENATYNIPAAIQLTGNLNIQALENSLNDIVERHESLRTRFTSIEGEAIQIIESERTINLEIINLETLEETQKQQQKQTLINHEASLPFNLANDPLIRSKLIKLDNNNHILLITMHHIISDGWSMGIFVEELSQLYRGYVQEKDIQLDPLAIQYADFAAWQREWIENQEGIKQLDYWQKQLNNAPQLINVPTDYPRPKIQSFRGATYQRLIPETLMSRLKKLSQEQETTLFVTFLTALKLLLFKWTQQKDLIVGTVIAGRNRIEIEPLIGCFMNFLALRSKINEEITIIDVLQQENQIVLDAYTNQDYPFEKVVEVINPERNISYNSIYNIALLLQNFPRSPLFGDDLEVTPIEGEREIALLDQRWEIFEDNQQTFLQCEYSTDLFKESTIKALVENYVEILQKILDNPQAKIGDIEIHQSLKEQIKNAQERDKKQSIVITSTFTIEPIESSLSYWLKKLNLPSEIELTAYNQVFQEILNPDSQLNQNTDGVNLILIRPEDWLRFAEIDESKDEDWQMKLRQNSQDLIDALQQHHSHLKVPLILVICPTSPNLSKDKQQVIHRIEKILMAQLKSFNRIHIISSDNIQNNYPVSDYYDVNRDEIGHIPYTETYYTALGTAIARKIYALQLSPYKVIVLDCDNTLWTGICGEDGAQGIMIDSNRQSLQELLVEQQKAGKLLCLCSKNQEEDVWAVFEEHPKMPLQKEYLVDWKINWQAKSENIKALAKDLNLGLDSFIFLDDNPIECAEVRANCPEVLTLQVPENPQEIPQWLKHIWAFDIVQTTAEDKKRTQMYRQQVEREQLKRESLTFGDFLNSLNLDIQIQPISTQNLPRVSQLTYRTNQFNLSTIRRSEGDMEQLLDSGELEGRMVTVKDRFGDYGLVGVMLFKYDEITLTIDTFLLSCRVLGKTVEYEMMKYLGNLAQERNLSEVVAPYYRTAKNQPILDFLNKINPNNQEAIEQGLLFEFTVETLSNLKFTSDEKTKLSGTSKGTDSSPKVGIKAPWQLITEIATELANPVNIRQEIEAKQQHIRSQTRGEYVAPRNKVEQQLVVIWQEVLRLDQVGIYDDFFELGGHSLLAVRLISEVQKEFNYNLPLATLFQHPTIEQFASLLKTDSLSVSWSSLVPIQTQGYKPPFFCVPGAGGNVLYFYELARCLGKERPFYGLQAVGLDGESTPHTTVEAMAKHYVELIQSVQSQGPYYLGGHSFGGPVVFEIAQQLQKQGESVALVAMLDSYAPQNSQDEREIEEHDDVYWLCALIGTVKALMQLKQDTIEEEKQLRNLSSEEQLLYVQSYLEQANLIAPNGDINQVQALFNIYKMNHQMVYQPQFSIPTNIVVFRAMESEIEEQDPYLGWRQWATESIKVHTIPGDHISLMLPPHVQVLADYLNQSMEETTLDA
ncbi:MAG: HAD-IIIC family phosphatase, partial [Microcystaceae cyanobacterium]